MDQRFRNHPKNKGKARKADKKIKTIAGRLIRELDRKLPPNLHQSLLALFKKILAQKKSTVIKFIPYMNRMYNV